MTSAFAGTVLGVPKRGQTRASARHAIRDVVADNVRAAMVKSGERAVDLAASAGVGRRTLNRLLKRGNSTLDTLGAIADALGVEAFELLVRKRRPLVTGNEHEITEKKVAFGAAVRHRRVRNP